MAILQGPLGKKIESGLQSFGSIFSSWYKNQQAQAKSIKATQNSNVLYSTPNPSVSTPGNTNLKGVAVATALPASYKKTTATVAQPVQVPQAQPYGPNLPAQQATTPMANAGTPTQMTGGFNVAGSYSPTDRSVVEATKQAILNGQELDTTSDAYKTALQELNMQGAPLKAGLPNLDTGLVEDVSANPITNNDLTRLATQQDQMRTQYLESLKPTQLEQDLTTQLSTIRENINNQLASYEAGAVDIMGQAIPMPFITGELANLEQRAGIKLNNLQRLEAGVLEGLGLAQEARKSNTEALKAGMSFIQADQELAIKVQEQLANKEMKVLDYVSKLNDSARNSLKTILDNFKGLDPDSLDIETQSYLAQTAAQSGIPYNVVYEGMKTVRDQMILENSLKIQKETGSTSNLTPQQMSDAIKKGYTTEAQLKMYEQMANGGITIPNAKEPTEAQSLSAIYSKRLVEADAIIDSIGSKFVGAESYIGQNLPNILKSAERQQYEQAQRNFVNAILRKESGAAIAETEFENAKKQYFPQPGDKPEVIKQKDINRGTAIKGLMSAAGNASGSGGDSLNLGFNPVGNDTKKVAEAIGKFESGGNYKAIGPVTSSGDKAYGKYQIMGNNIPSWSKAALGRSITVKEFMASPELQDKIALYKMGELGKKYGNVEDIASVWFSGRPLAKAGNAKDVIGTTVPQYVKNVVSIYKNIG